MLTIYHADKITNVNILRVNQDIELLNKLRSESYNILDISVDDQNITSYNSQCNL